MTDHYRDHPLDADEITKLAAFNAEVARGLVHRPGYAYEMAKLQKRADAWALQQADEMPVSVRISSSSPYVTGGASVSQEELDQVSEEIGHA